MITTIEHNGQTVEVGDAAAAAEIAGIKLASFRHYRSRKIPKNNPIPDPVARDMATGAYLYVLDEMHAWVARRTGPGNWGGPSKGFYNWPVEAQEAFRAKHREAREARAQAQAIAAQHP